jgi:hypothetical protein
MSDEWLRQLERDPDGTWQALRRQAIPFGRQGVVVAFGMVMHDPRPERRRVLIEISAPARRIIVPVRYWDTEGIEEVRVVWPGGAVSVPPAEIAVRRVSEHQLILELLPFTI